MKLIAGHRRQRRSNSRLLSKALTFVLRWNHVLVSGSEINRGREADFA
jgi:hypothetical protein